MTTPAAPVAAPDWKKMKVQELRDELVSRGLDTSGVKSILIERLEAVPPKAEDNVADTKEDGDDRKDMDLDINEGVPALDSLDVKQVAGESITTEPPVVAEDLAAESLPDTSNPPPVDEAAEVGAAEVPPQSTAPVTNGAGAVAPPSDLEKKQRRAERFGLELLVSEGEKRRLRAARFGESVASKTNGATKEDESSKMSPTSKDAEAVKRKARAARFGIEEVGDKPAAAQTGTQESKKKARLARFGLDIKLDPQEQEKKKLRAARFGLTTEAKPDIEPEKEVAVEQPVATGEM